MPFTRIPLLTELVESDRREDLPNIVLQKTIQLLATELRIQTMSNAQDRAGFRELETQFQNFNERFLNSIVDTVICQGKILPTDPALFAAMQTPTPSSF